MTTQKIDRSDEIPLILHWLLNMLLSEIIDTIWHLYYNWQGLSYFKMATLFITYVIHSLSHRFSGMFDKVIKHKTVLEKVTGWKISDKDATFEIRNYDRRFRF